MSSERTSGAETELKFDVTLAALRRLARHPAMAGEVKAQALKATYYDTATLCLREAGVSLRVRKEGDRFIQTVKRAAGPEIFARDEWESEIASAAVNLQALALTPAADLLGDDRLIPVFTSTVSRQTRVWICDGTVIEITIDRGKLIAGKQSEPVLEMELELKSGRQAALFDLARQLFDAAPIRLSLLTKSDRGFALAGLNGDRRTKASPTPLAPDMTITEAFRRIARSCLMQTVAAATSLCGVPSAEGVHQTRIGLRRLRTAMKIFQPAVDDSRAEWIEQEARWIAGELGDARTLDVFLEDGFEPTAPLIGDAKATARYGVQLNSARMAAYDKALAAVASPRFARAMLETAIWVEDGDWRRASERAAILESPIGPFAAHALDGLRRRVKRRGANLGALDTDLRHKLRIRAKRLRYATGFFELAFGENGEKRRRRFTAALKALQDSLGRLNDIALTEAAAIAGLDGAKTPSLAFAAGQIVGHIKVQEPVAVDKAIEAFEDFTEAKRFWPKKRVEKEAT